MENRHISILRGARSARCWMAGAILAFAVAACQTEEKPDYLLTEPQMVDVMMDIYIAEQKVQRLGLPQDSSLQVFALMEARLYKEKGVADSSFQESLNYYMDKPEVMHRIYTALVDSLQLLEQRVPQHEVQ